MFFQHVTLCTITLISSNDFIVRYRGHMTLKYDIHTDRFMMLRTMRSFLISLYFPGTRARSYAFPSLTISAALLLQTSCRPVNDSWRTYEEISIQAQESQPHVHKDQSAAVPSKSELSWKRPKTWREEPSSGMRMAAFSIQGNNATGTCTIIRLSGSAGGLEANVQRWIGQLNLPAMSPGQLGAFLGKQGKITSSDGREILIVDLTSLGSDAEDEATILAAVLTIDSSSYFIKLNGPAGLVNRERASFLELCRSLSTLPKT
jgi:hypothetical protein